MLQVMRGAERGFADHGWLKSYHTFSFADYDNPDWVQYGPLRVINEDYVAPGQGFGKHGHRDMEIITYILEGELEHKDSMGNGSVIRPGDVQRMSAGTGVLHSEFNPSATQQVHLLQIWIIPQAQRLAPGYEQKHFIAAERRGRLRLIAAPGWRGRRGGDQPGCAHLCGTLFRGESRRRSWWTPAGAPGRSSPAAALSVDDTQLAAGDAAYLEGPAQAATARRPGCGARAVRPALKPARSAAPAGSGPPAAPQTAT